MADTFDSWQGFKDAGLEEDTSGALFIGNEIQKQGVNCGALAKSLGVNKNEIRHWRRGSGMIPRDKIEKLSRILECKIVD